MRMRFDHGTPDTAADRARPALVGHRGAPRRARENTVASFLAAADEGASWVELDVRRTADDMVAVIHDAVTPDGRPVVEQSAEELARKGVPDLAGVLPELPSWLGVDVECKNLPGDPDYDEDQRLAGMVADVLADHRRRSARPLLLSSFNPVLLEAAGPRLAGVPIGLVHSDGLTVAAGIELAGEFGAAVLCPHVDSVDLDVEAVAAAHAAHLAVMVWTVDDPATARTLAAAGVDAICTNDTGGILGALSAETP